MFPPVTAYRHALKQLAREQRKLSGKRKFSANWKKQKAKITRLHQRIAELRKTILHQVSTAIISKNHAVVVLEDLNAANMTASAKGTVETPGRNVRQKSGLHKSILDQGWGMLKRMLEYKLRWRGGMLLLVNPALHVANLRGLQRGGRREPPEPGRVPLPALRSYGARRRERGKKYPRKRIAVNGGARRVSLFRRLGGEVAAPQRRRRNRSGRSQAAAGRKESFPFRTRRLSIHVDFAEHAGPCGWCSGDAQPSFAVTRHHQEVTSPWSGPAVARIIPPAPAEYPSTRPGCGRIRGPGCSWT